jgi:hypothetical protein
MIQIQPNSKGPPSKKKKVEELKVNENENKEKADVNNQMNFLNELNADLQK